MHNLFCYYVAHLVPFLKNYFGKTVIAGTISIIIMQLFIIKNSYFFTATENWQFAKSSIFIAVIGMTFALFVSSIFSVTCSLAQDIRELRKAKEEEK